MSAASALSGTGVIKANMPEALVIAGFVRGLSVLDVEAALMEAPLSQMLDAPGMTTTGSWLMAQASAMAAGVAS